MESLSNINSEFKRFVKYHNKTLKNVPCIKKSKNKLDFFKLSHVSDKFKEYVIIYRKLKFIPYFKKGIINKDQKGLNWWF